MYQNFEMQNVANMEETSYGSVSHKNDQIRKDFREIWIWNTYKNEYLN